MKWNTIESINDLNAITERSKTVPCLIFKHSTRCPVSSMARYRLEDDWNFPEAELEPYFLDLIKHRDISGAIAQDFQVRHESPQVLLIRNGECTYDASHLDITVDEIRECYADV